MMYKRIPVRVEVYDRIKPFLKSKGLSWSDLLSIVAENLERLEVNPVTTKENMPVTAKEDVAATVKEDRSRCLLEWFREASK